MNPKLTYQLFFFLSIFFHHTSSAQLIASVTFCNTIQADYSLSPLDPKGEYTYVLEKMLIQDVWDSKNKHSERALLHESC
ncbi:MAG TPA: hypothetical protein DCF33_06030, partial [Saprospirales bacterium]|nr:hypothetical protein [Saprospirales bacterium]